MPGGASSLQVGDNQCVNPLMLVSLSHETTAVDAQCPAIARTQINGHKLFAILSLSRAMMRVKPQAKPLTCRRSWIGRHQLHIVQPPFFLEPDTLTNLLRHLRGHFLQRRPPSFGIRFLPSDLIRLYSIVGAP
jgi:hypothetical protein